MKIHLVCEDISIALLHYQFWPLKPLSALKGGRKLTPSQFEFKKEQLKNLFFGGERTYNIGRVGMPFGTSVCEIAMDKKKPTTL